MLPVSFLQPSSGFKVRNKLFIYVGSLVCLTKSLLAVSDNEISWLLPSALVESQQSQTRPVRPAFDGARP